MADKIAKRKRSVAQEPPNDQGEINSLKNQIQELNTELSFQRERLDIWNEIAEEGLFIHENFILKEVNQALLNLTGYKEEELVNRNGKLLFTEDAYQKIQQHMIVGDSDLLELEMIKKNGQKIYVSAKEKEIVVGKKIQKAVLVQNINEFKKTQASLKKSEERHRLISKLLSDYVYTCKIKPNKPPIISWVSGSIETVSGYSAEEIDRLDNGWFSIIHPEDVNKVVDSLHFNHENNALYRSEYRIIDKNRKIRWLLDKSMRIGFDSKTKELTLLGATKDVTERILIQKDLKQKNYEYEVLNKNLGKKNEQLLELNKKLAESEKKYKLLVENSTIGVGIAKDEHILFANKSLLKIFGVDTFEQFASKKLTDYLPEESKKMVREMLSKSINRSNQRGTFRHEIIRADGQIRTINLFTSEILFEGQYCRQALISDITSELETENALIQASNIFKNIQIGLLIYRLDDLEDDRSLRMIAVNPAAAHLIGISEDQMIGEKIDDLFPNLRLKRIPQQYAEVVRTQIPISVDDIHYEDERVAPAFFSVKVFPLPDQCVGISFENVSIRRRVERDLLIRNQELNNFVYKVSHDLRAPLSSIKGLINLSKLEKNQANHLPKIEERVDHLDGFIRDILSHSRNLNTAVIIERIDLKQVVYDCIEDLRYLSNADDVNKTIKTNESDFYSDKIRIMEICRNMVSNAIKYQDQTKDEKYLKVEISIDGESAKMAFTDNGIGIDKNYLDKIFDMFFRATEQAEGSGIGLYIVKQALEKINGQIVVKSKPEGGTTFTIEIPNLISQKKLL